MADYPDFSTIRMTCYPALSESMRNAQGYQVKSSWFANRTLPVLGRGSDVLFFSSSAGGGITNVTEQLFFNDTMVGKVAVNTDNTSFSGSRANSLTAGLSADSGMLQNRFSYAYVGFTYGMTDLDPGTQCFPAGTYIETSPGKVEDLSGKFIPWHDKNQFNAVQYLKDSSSLQWPIVNDDPSAIDMLDYNGIIEPLTIRSVIGMSSTFLGDNLDPEPYGIRAGIGSQYVEEQYRRFTLVTNFYDTDSSSKNYPFAYVVDWHLYEGFSFTVPDSTYTDNDDMRALPFKERTIEEIVYEDVGDLEIQRYLVYNTSASMDDRLKKNSKSKPCGFTYENSVFGTDSLAFGGLVK